MDFREEGGAAEVNRTISGTDNPHPGRKLTKDERQVLLEHPELVMLRVKWGPDIKRIAIFFIPGIMSVLIPAALAFSPFGRSHPGLVTVLSIALLVLFCAVFVWLYLYFDKKRYEDAQMNCNIRLLKRTLPEELFCKIVTIKYIIEQQAEGVYIEDGEEKLFGYTGYNNCFRLVPNTDAAVVTDDKNFWAFIKRDDATESFYSRCDQEFDEILS